MPQLTEEIFRGGSRYERRLEIFHHQTVCDWYNKKFPIIRPSRNILVKKDDGTFVIELEPLPLVLEKDKWKIMNDKTIKEWMKNRNE